MMRVLMRACGATHPGRARDNNEDAFAVLLPLGAAILADGMGGHSCGEVGSAITVQAVSEYLEAPEPGLSREEMCKEAIRAANRKVIEAARLRSECEGMGSTVVLAMWQGAELVLANVGDSRAYLYRGGNLRQLTYDQNFGNELRTQLGFSEERVRSMPNRNVLTMAVGSFEHVLVRTQSEYLEAGDLVLLCSDGLYNPVEHEEMVRLLEAATGIEQAVEALVDSANQNGGPDNVTAILLQYVGDGEGGNG
jgi:protein phosphatase